MERGESEKEGNGKGGKKGLKGKGEKEGNKQKRNERGDLSKGFLSCK